MANLYDALKSKLDGAPPAALGSEQAQIQSTLAAKSGKAGAGSAVPGASNVAESAAISSGNAQLAQTQAAGQQMLADVGQQQTALANQDTAFQAGQTAQAATAATELATKNMVTREGIDARADQAGMKTQSKEAIGLAQIAQAANSKLKELAAQRGTTVDDIFADFDISNKELESRKDGAALEQAGFLLAMQDKAYVSEMQRVGQERGLQDDLAFREEAQRLAWGNELSNLTDKLAFQTGYNARDRGNERALAAIDIDWAMKFANAAIRDANNRAIAQGVTDTGKAGADAYAKYESPAKVEAVNDIGGRAPGSSSTGASKPGGSA